MTETSVRRDMVILGPMLSRKIPTGICIRAKA